MWAISCGCNEIRTHTVEVIGDDLTMSDLHWQHALVALFVSHWYLKRLPDYEKQEQWDCFKGTVSLKNRNSVIYSPSSCFKPVRVIFIFWAQKKAVAIDLYWVFHTVEVNGYRQLFGYQHSSNIFFCAPKDLVMTEMMTEFIFGRTIPVFFALCVFDIIFPTFVSYKWNLQLIVEVQRVLLLQHTLLAENTLINACTKINLILANLLLK